MLNSDLIAKSFNEDEVPINYQWSGYSANCEEFKKINFLKIDIQGISTYVCSEENGVALGDYLSKYIFKSPYFRDMESVFSPGYDYWFFKAWEQAQPNYSELDVWVHHIVELLVSSDLVARITVGNTEYFAFSNLTIYEEKALPDAVVLQGEKICKEDLLEFCEQSYADYGNADELSVVDVSPWAADIIKKFIQSHK